MEPASLGQNFPDQQSSELVFRVRRRADRRQEQLPDDWSQLQLAYAITSHRTGLRWDDVVVVLSQSHYLMLQRNLLYTAPLPALAGEQSSSRAAGWRTRPGASTRPRSEVVSNDKIARRYGGLAERLTSELADCLQAAAPAG
jgi:hypothetical protein